MSKFTCRLKIMILNAGKGVPYFMATIFGDENISFRAFSTWGMPTSSCSVFESKASCSAISTARRQISKHLLASPDNAAT